MIDRRHSESLLDAISRLRSGERTPLAAWLRRHLFEHVLPFWERHALDPAGGLLTCISDSGQVQSTEKWLWSQWRAVWVFSRIHNTLNRDPRWLRYARHIAEFCARTGWAPGTDGWPLLISQDGAILRGHESTYVDAFAVYGLNELYAATSDEDVRRLGIGTAEAALRELSGARDRVPHFPYPIPPGAKPHGIPMIWSLTLAELATVLQSERYFSAAKLLSEEIFRDFLRRDRDVVVEFVRADGTELAGAQGRAVVPGHVIEDMWFQLHVGRLLGEPPIDPREILRLMLRHLEIGWDSASGGLRLAIDAEGREPVGWGFPDTKLWWPHTEALYATLTGWDQSQQPIFLDWYERLWRLCLSHFVDWENGEWRQKLDRSLHPLEGTIALPVKDPFHLPRSLILQIELLEGLHWPPRSP